MLQLVTVCHPSRAFIFYSGHPDVCTAIIIIIMIIIIIIMIIIVIIIIILIIIINSDKFLIPSQERNLEVLSECHGNLSSCVAFDCHLPANKATGQIILIFPFSFNKQCKRTY